MEEVLSTLGSALADFFGRTAARRREAARALRDALTARSSDVRGAPPARPAARRAGVAREASPAVAAERPSPERTSTASRPAGKPDDRAEADAAVGESRLVRSLFAGPQALAAAFIAAEILAQPVALRER